MIILWSFDGKKTLKTFMVHPSRGFKPQKKAEAQKAPEASPGLFQSLVMLSGCVIDCIILILILFLLKPSSKKAVAQKKAPEASPGRNVRPSVGLAFTCFHHAFCCHTLYYNMYCVAILFDH